MDRSTVQQEIRATRQAMTALRAAVMASVTPRTEAPDQRDALLKLAEIFADQAGLKLSTVSTYAANDGKWIDGLKGGASCTLRKAATVVQWFSTHWPEDLEWPSDIPRPKPKSKEAE